MNKPRLFSITIIALLWMAFAAYVWLTAAQLPERVATHFGVGGEPNGWMTRAEHLRFILLMGIGVPAFILGTFVLIGRLRGWGLNIPHKDYWLSPERRAQTFGFIQQQGFWLAGLMILFLAGVHRSIITANLHSPASLHASSFGWLVGGFLSVLAVWMVCFVGRFYRKPA